MKAPSPELDVLRISVRPSPATGDHEVCLRTGSDDLISCSGDGLIGMDPDDLLIAPSPLLPSASAVETTIGRCDCGIVDCGSVAVTILRAANIVSWTTQRRWVGVSFDAEQYEAEVGRAVRDHSWETPDRTAARLIRTGIVGASLSQHGLRFCWASGRVAASTMTIALEYTPGPTQVLLHVDWPDGDPRSIADRCLQLLSEAPPTWPNVRWIPQGHDLGKPRIAGSGWTS